MIAAAPSMLSLAGAFFKSNGKMILIVAAIAAAGYGYHRFQDWKRDLVATATLDGFKRAETQYVAAVEEANAVSAADQKRLDQMVATFGTLTAARGNEITLKVQPQIESIRHEVSNNPMYGTCRVDDGVLDKTNSVRATVNASIAAGNPQRD